MSRRKTRNGDVKEQHEQADLFPTDENFGEGASLADFYEDPNTAEASGDADETTAREEAVVEVLKLIEAVKADILANKDKIAGLIMVCGWRDASMTHGWTGNFDPTLTAGKLFNLATDFSVYAAMQKMNMPALSKNELN